MAWLLAIFGFLTKLLDFLNPWSGYWADKAKTRDAKKAETRKKLDESAKKEGGNDAFLDDLNNSNNP
jgi:hypothetical protein